jgi:hypothetical protein
MWKVNPTIMCRQHLLGEHLEMHMLVGAITKGKSIKGFVKSGLVDTSYIKQRHDELVKEMQNRGYNHKSPLEYNDVLKQGYVDVVNSEKELLHRCEKCYSNYNENKI